MSKRLALTALTFAFLAGPWEIAAADAWLSDNFDSYANGSLAGQGGWTGDAGVMRVQTGFVKSGKAVQGNCLLWGGGVVTRAVSVSGGYHYIDYDAAPNSLHVFAFHAFPEDLTIIKTQSIFELG